MRDYDKELADSLDKSDQIAKLEAKVEELQRQLDECQTMRGACVLVPQKELEHMQRQLAEREIEPVAWLDKKRGKIYPKEFYDQYKDCEIGSAGFDLIKDLVPLVLKSSHYEIRSKT